MPRGLLEEEERNFASLFISIADQVPEILRHLYAAPIVHQVLFDNLAIFVFADEEGVRGVLVDLSAGKGAEVRLDRLDVIGVKVGHRRQDVEVYIVVEAGQPLLEANVLEFRATFRW